MSLWDTWVARFPLLRLDRRDGRQDGAVAVYVKHGSTCTYLSHLTHANLEDLCLLLQFIVHILCIEKGHASANWRSISSPKANNSEIIDYYGRPLCNRQRPLHFVSSFFSKHSFSAVSAPIFSKLLHTTRIRSSAIENFPSTFSWAHPKRNKGTKTTFWAIFFEYRIKILQYHS